jgi:hypothetical protein
MEVGLSLQEFCTSSRRNDDPKPSMKKETRFMAAVG